MISQITPVLQGIEQPDGQTIANARGFTDNDDNGALNVEMGEDWSGDEPVTISSLFYAVSLAANTTYTIDYNGTADKMTMPSVQFENSGGQAQGTPMTGEWDESWTEYTVTPASFTPGTAGIYYIHISYSGDWTTVPLLVSPRPQEHSCVTRRLWKAYPWEVKSGIIVEKQMSGIPVPVLELPLLNNATPSVNAVNATITTNGSINFNGGATPGSDETGNFISVTMPGLFAGSYTVSAAWYAVDPGNNWSRSVLGLWDMDKAITGNSGGATLGLYSRISAGGVGAVEIFHQFSVGEWLYIIQISEPWKFNQWHTISMALDRDSAEVRVMVDCKLYGTYRFRQKEIDLGMFDNTGSLQLVSIENQYPEMGKLKNVQVVASAMDFNQMRYLSSTLLS